MKIRIQGNSIRMRLSKSNVDQLTSQGIISEKISFGPTALIYAIQRDETAVSISTSFINAQITIHVPSDLIENWATNDVVGFSEEQPIADNQNLFILIEKDFKCTDQRNEDQSDFYDNPNLIC